jgi:hypothetical protein
MIRAVAFASAATALMSPALAQHEGDIALAIDGARIATGVFAAGPAVQLGLRVFASTFGTSVANFTNDPGFDCLPGTFEPGSQIRFTIMGQLRRWTGAGLELSPLQIRVGLGPVTPVFSPTTDTPVQGFSLAVASNGQWHRHLQYTLQAPATDGVYSLEMQLSSNQSGLESSNSFWLVFNQNRSIAEHDAAVQWIITNLAGGGVSPACNRADITDIGDTGAGPDGQLTVDDIIAFVNTFGDGTGCPGAGPCNRADITDIGDTGAGADGELTVDDIIAFVNAFGDGCV